MPRKLILRKTPAKAWRIRIGKTHIKMSMMPNVSVDFHFTIYGSGS